MLTRGEGSHRSDLDRWTSSGGCGDDLSDSMLTVLAHGTLTSHHATQFRAFSRVVRHRYGIERILAFGKVPFGKS